MHSSATQANALQSSVGFRNRPDLLVYRLEGEDQRSWLNGQVTGDVRSTHKGDSVYCLAITVRGRIMADIWALDDGECFRLLIPATSLPQLLESFESQIIMEDVELTAEPKARVVSVLGPKSRELMDALQQPDLATYPGDELGHGGLFIVTQESNCEHLLHELAKEASSMKGMQVDEAGYELARLRQHVPRYGRDFDVTSYPQEAGLKLRAVAFDKGCYLGQEVVCTLENRGKLSRLLCSLELGAEVPTGTELTSDDGAVVGRITSVAFDPESSLFLALGYVKRAKAVSGQTVVAGQASAIVRSVVGEAD